MALTAIQLGHVDEVEKSVRDAVRSFGKVRDALPSYLQTTMVLDVIALKAADAARTEVIKRIREAS